MNTYIIESDQRNILQENYQIQVNEYGLESELLYDSGVVASDQSVGILESDGLPFEKTQGGYRAKAGSGKYEIHYRI